MSRAPSAPRFCRGAFALEPSLRVRCACGAETRLLRRGRVYLLPAGHDCPARRTQADVLRTLALEEAAGVRTTEAEVDRRLRLWGLGGDLLWRYSEKGLDDDP